MRDLRSVVTLSIALCAVVTAAPSVAEHPACNPADLLRGELAKIDPDLSGCETGEPCREQARTRLEELLTEHGFDFHLTATRVHLERSDGVRDKEAIAKELQTVARERGNDVDAWALAGTHTGDEAGRELLEKTLAMDPDHPWAHLSMAARQLRDDKEMAAESLSRFLEQCPSRLRDTKTYPQRVGDSELWRRHLPALEQAATSLPEAERLVTLPNLWRMQFAALPPDQHEAIRGQVAQQLTEIHQLDRRSKSAWWDTLAEGYELTGNAPALETLKRERMTEFPCQDESIAQRIEGIMKKHDPEADDMRIKAKMLEFTAEQLPEVTADLDALDSECEANRTVASWRFRLLEQQEDATAERVLAVANAYLTGERSNPSGVRLGSPEYQVAKLFVERGVAIKRVPALIEEARGNKPELHKLRAPAHFLERMEASQQRTDVHMARLAGEAHHALGQSEAARREGKLASTLYQALDTETHGDSLVELHEQLTGFLKTAGLPALPGPAPKKEEKDEAQVASWQDVEEPLSDFSLTDMNGRVWTRADFDDRGVLINFWATWCIPCIAELPEIQALHETLAEVEGLTVVTFNTDRSVGKVKPFLDKRDFSFPIILAADFLPVESRSIPQNWVVDRQHIVRKKSMGFSVDGPGEWRNDALKVLQEVAGSAETNNGGGAEK